MLQLLAHLFLLQDIVGADALSAGVWYVAIDFQLFALFALVQSLSRRRAIVACATLATLSLFWLNRIPALDVWAPYFFATYGMGALACWFQAGAAQRMGCVAGCFGHRRAGGRMAQPNRRWRGDGADTRHYRRPSEDQDDCRRMIEALAEQSYALFLVHYPVLLAVGAVVHRLWPFDPFANVAGLVAAWVCSLVLSWGLFQAVEARRARWRVVR